MSKKLTVYFECSHCGNESSKWLGRCPSCGEWNTYKEVKTPPKTTQNALGPANLAGASNKPFPLDEIPLHPEDRLDMGSTEFNRVLGGGMLKSSAVLLGGEPGIGKSTLLLQAAAGIAKDYDVLYISGEESAQQIKLRADRLGFSGKGIHLLASSHLEDIYSALTEIQPKLVIMDSVQTLFSPEAASAPGSPGQIKTCVHLLSEAARNHGAALLLIAHVTKDGSIAGPKLLEHMVDVVLYFEEGDDGLRMLRAWKNRYGSTDEIGLFTMNAKGLLPLENTQDFLPSLRQEAAPPGVVLCPVYEGSRILPVEIQALTVSNKAGLSRVYSERIDQRKIARIAAVLEKHGGLSFNDQEIYINVAGGLKIQDVGVDLALAAALYSARSGLAVPKASCFIGELSLSGEIRKAKYLDKRLAACKDFGIQELFTPGSGSKGSVSESENIPGLHATESISQLLQKAFGKARKNDQAKN